MEKTFTHPLDIDVLKEYVDVSAVVMDYGCGYGRLTRELSIAGFKKSIGFDTSVELIKRGRDEGCENIFVIDSVDQLPIEDDSVDCILLFAVLTCIPQNSEQQKLIKTLVSKLKTGGILWVSDYYIQTHLQEVREYTCFNEDDQNDGVFTMPDGGVFRHHTHEWIQALFKDLKITRAYNLEVNTLNGNKANAFQLIITKL